MPHIVIFDVNETLLDLAELDPVFEQIFGTSAVRSEWFGQVLQSALLSIVLDHYVDFGAVGAGALEMVAARHGQALSDSDRSSVSNRMRMLPPHPDVPRALQRLHEAGVRLGALTNSTLEVAHAQLTNASIAQYFEQILSADSVRRLKPAAAVYHHAAESFGVEAKDIRLIAAHAWDVAGALSAGCAAAFVARPGKTIDPLFPRPDIVERDLEAIASRILERRADRA